MLGQIISVKNDEVKVKLSINLYETENLISKNVVFKGATKIVGEIKDKVFYYGDIIKPAFSDKVNLITEDELDIIFHDKKLDYVNLGKSYIYPDYPINLNINSFFSNHFAILGNTGSGKSYSVARIIQSIFYESPSIPYRANIFLFDAYGEYQEAFRKIGDKSVNINYKVYTTNFKDTNKELLNIPFYLLGVDDIAILLEADDRKQISVIEESLKLVCLFSKQEMEILEYKNDIIARSLLDIMFSSRTNVEIRTRITAVLSKFNTSTLNLDSEISEPGWTRTLRQCLFIDNAGKISNIELVTKFLQSFVKDNLELVMPDGSFSYTLNEYYQALEFALIEEGILNSDKVYDYANILKVRLSNLINSEYAKYFEVNEMISKNEYIKKLLTTNDNRKAQVINFNINYVDDRFAKSLVKIYSKLLFDYITSLKVRASLPFHIVLEEAHRYVQNDKDVSILGYNIFERITKEGRKYGILLGVITQRPSELSETALSQASNFLIFKMFHPKDLKFISEIIPNLTDNILNKLKTLHPGTCIAFGNAFKMPVIVKLEKPNPEPESSNSDIVETWYLKNK